MEVFQNGRFSTGEPVYQVGTKNADGTYNTVVYDLMTKEQAEAKLEAMGVKKPVEKKPVAKKKAPAKKKSASKK
jgi:uncharacterized protein (UPF0333 family)